MGRKKKEEHLTVMCVESHPYKGVPFFAGEKYSAIRMIYGCNIRYIIKDASGQRVLFVTTDCAKEDCFGVYFEELSIMRKRKIDLILKNLDE